MTTICNKNIPCKDCDKRVCTSVYDVYTCGIGMNKVLDQYLIDNKTLECVCYWNNFEPYDKWFKHNTDDGYISRRLLTEFLKTNQFVLHLMDNTPNRDSELIRGMLHLTEVNEDVYKIIKTTVGRLEYYLDTHRSNADFSYHN